MVTHLTTGAVSSSPGLACKIKALWPYGPLATQGSQKSDLTQDLFSLKASNSLDLVRI